MQSYLQRFAGSKRSWLPEPDPDDVELSVKRRCNDERHESRWSSIIDRYSRDFTDCGDEIDLRTGSVVVNKGHLERMRDEFDNGDGAEKSPRRQQSVLGEMMLEDGLGIEGGEEFVEVEEGNSPLDSGDDEEDELNSDWPTSSPQQHRRQSPEIHVKSKSPSMEDRFEEAEQFMDGADTESETQEPVRTIEQPESEPARAQPAPSVVPQFQMPQLGFSGQMETAMQAMSTAMGAAIQAQMMAFMNVVLATRGTADAPGVAAPSVNTPAPVSTVMPTAPSPHAAAHPRAPPDTIRNQRQPIVAHGDYGGADTRRRPHGSSIALSPGNELRGQTPGFGSLWAIPARKKAGRPKQSSSNRPSKLAQADQVAGSGSQMHNATSTSFSRNHRDHSEDGNRASSEVFQWQASASSPLPDLSTLGVAGPTVGQPASEPRRFSGQPKRSVEQTPHSLAARLIAAQPEVPRPRLAQRPSLDIPFIDDSDEDEISALTPSSSARRTDSAVETARQIVPIEVSRLDSTGVSRSTSVGDSPRTTAAEQTAEPSPPNPHSRLGLRNKKASLNYNETDTFSGLLGSLNDNDDTYPITDLQKKHVFYSRRYPQQAANSDREDTIDFEPAETSRMARHTSASSPETPSVQSTGEDRSPALLLGSNKQTANVSVPRSYVQPRPDLNVRDCSVVMDPDELAARYAALRNRDKVHPLRYEDRPPPLPCAHCKTTASAAWLINPEGGVRRLCNACHGYFKKHGGRKRPTTLEEFRTFKHKVPCDNCAKLAVRDWHSMVDGKRLCKPCKLYAKMNNGALRSVARPKMTACDRCDARVIKTLGLSNKGWVCIDCHNEIFADYDPANDHTGTTEAEELGDWGETFFDFCSLIFSYEILPSAVVGRRSPNNMPNVGGLPCKACHATTASNWRPALDSAMMCEVCYDRVTKLIGEHDLQNRLGKDMAGHIDGLKTSGFECERCQEAIVRAKWRAGAPGGGNIVCTPCFRLSHKI